MRLLGFTQLKRNCQAMRKAFVCTIMYLTSLLHAQFLWSKKKHLSDGGGNVWWHRYFRLEHDSKQMGGKTSFEQGPEHFCLYWFRLRRFQSKQMPPSTYRLFESFSFVTNNVIQTKPPSGKWLVSFFENQHCSKWPVPKLRFSWTRHC